MRILSATGLFPPDIGGPATYSKLLSRELPLRGVDIEVLAFSEVRHLPKLIRHCAYFFKALLRGRRADVIYAQDPVSVGLPALLAAKVLGKKFLLRVAGDYAWEQGVQRFGVRASLDDFQSLPLRHPVVNLLRRIERAVARRARRIIVPSRYLQKIIVSWGVTYDRVSVVHNVFEGEIPTESKDVLRQKLSIATPSIVSVGRLVSWKGFRELIAAMPAVLKNGEAHLYLIGDGPLRTELEALIKDKGLERHVSLLGRLPQAVMHNYVRAADVFVLNSSYEGFSHQLLEVMAMETPIVASDIPGNREVIKHNENGLLISLEHPAALVEAITTLFANRDHRDSNTKFLDRSYRRPFPAALDICQKNARAHTRHLWTYRSGIHRPPLPACAFATDRSYPWRAAYPTDHPIPP